jgi:glycosyltransferase involved in cell wall biosynthesis
MVLNRYLPIKGGAEIQAHLLCRQLIARGHHVHIITRKIDSALPTDDVIDGIPIHRLAPVGLGHIANVVMFFRMLVFLLWHAQNYDVLHVHSIGPVGLATLLTGKLTNTPTVIKIPTYGDISRSGTTHSQFTHFIRRYILPQYLWQRILGLADAMVILSDEIMTEAHHAGLSHNIHRIPNGVDLAQFHPIEHAQKQAIRATLSIADNHFVMFFSGRLVHRKRVDMLIDAFTQIAHHYPNCHVIIAGTGHNQHDSVEDTLHQRVHEYKLTQRVSFLGDIEIENVADYLQAVDCFVFPSEREGLPNAILEAMACGLPIIASRIDALTALLSDETAYFVDVGNVDHLAHMLAYVLDHPDEAQYKARNAAIRAQQYAITRVTNTYEALYRKLLSP